MHIDKRMFIHFVSLLKRNCSSALTRVYKTLVGINCTGIN